ncbi:acyl-CoA synthetase [Actinokineospora sp. UTMC 2448]|uniref:acyl-CoA synthetase n=1 Tax=Actinokineospora sp. UTMC 2448 TaxID=2268449 RepID=UPI002164D78E|nr:acyl-CoA synthetase [Actinokineospora sp. UTMC 2448]UVS82108.1 Long-chain-fatty-acid--CoA ligase [Actinokineospora sp. UTMC 2448]
MLLPQSAPERVAVRFPGLTLTHGEVASAARAVAEKVRGCSRVAVWATPSPETVLAVVGCLAAGVAVVPLNPKVGARELAHILADSAPELLLHAPADDPGIDLPRHAVDVAARVSGEPLPEPDGESVAFVVYTSGTTGPPKGVLLPRRAVASNLDALAEIWAWTPEDVVVHALPLFHVHGLIVGVLGTLRRGGTMWHLGRFTSAAVGQAFRDGATVMFGVPTMYHRLGLDCAADADLAAAVGRARLLVSGSAALPATDHARITEATGQRVVERYGMTETLMNCGVRADGERRPGIVGPALPGVEVRLADVVDGMGEIEVRGPNLFLGYLNRPDATAAAFVDGWFRTGDMAVREADGAFRIVGRRATDLIKSGGYKIGAGEIENALLEHPGVAEAAVTGEPDDDLGERIVAWVVPDGEPPSAAELADHVAALLAPHKRPRVVRYLDALPRNEMGKVTKRALHG